MKKLALSLSLLAAFCMAALSTASAQGRGGAHGRPATAGRPAMTGLDRAETTANAQGVSHGIDNAEAKQAAHKKADLGKAKGKSKKHHKNGK